VKHSGLITKVERDSGPCSLLNSSPESLQKGFDITPLDVPGNGLGEDRCQSSSLLPVHGRIVVQHAITDKSDSGLRSGGRRRQRPAAEESIAASLAAPGKGTSVLLLTGNCGNEPFGSRSEPGILMNRTIHWRSPGEIPEGRAEFEIKPGIPARQRTLEPERETGVTLPSHHQVPSDSALFSIAA